jgi:hypothetical protein
MDKFIIVYFLRSNSFSPEATGSWVTCRADQKVTDTGIRLETPVLLSTLWTNIVQQGIPWLKYPGISV